MKFGVFFFFLFFFFIFFSILLYLPFPELIILDGKNNFFDNLLIVTVSHSDISFSNLCI